MSAAKIIVATLRADATIGPLIGNARVYPIDAVPDEAERPWINYQVASNVADRDLSGTINGYAAEVAIEVVADSYSGVQTILARLAAAFDAIDGTTVAGSVIEAVDADETGDEINGPINLNDGEAFVGSGQISLYFRGA